MCFHWQDITFTRQGVMWNRFLSFQEIKDRQYFKTLLDWRLLIAAFLLSTVTHSFHLAFFPSSWLMSTVHSKIQNHIGLVSLSLPTYESNRAVESLIFPSILPTTHGYSCAEMTLVFAPDQMKGSRTYNRAYREVARANRCFKFYTKFHGSVNILLCFESWHNF